jgi:hypothetical protein
LPRLESAKNGRSDRTRSNGAYLGAYLRAKIRRLAGAFESRRA